MSLLDLAGKKDLVVDIANARRGEAVIRGNADVTDELMHGVPARMAACAVALIAARRGERAAS